MKKESSDQFINVYSDVYEEGFCQHLINEFERIACSGATSDRIKSEGAKRHHKNDSHVFLDLRHQGVGSFNEKNTINLLYNGLQECFEDYSQNFSILKDLNLRGNTLKMQSTAPGQGYHLWHGEQGKDEASARCLVWILYLNTLAEEEAGETEFLYQKRRIKPVENTMVFWPASFTHAHRGNTVFGNTSKYVVTGWFYKE